MPQGGARGQNLGHLRFFLLLILLYGIIQFEQQVLLGYFSLSLLTVGFSGPDRGQRKISMTHQLGVYVPLRALFLVAYAKTKMQISCAVTAQLISDFVFATWIVRSLFYLNPKFQASSHLLWVYSLVCVGPGQKPRRPVFSQRGSYRPP